MIENINHPSKIVVPLHEGLKWRSDNAIYQAKADGKFHVLTHGENTLLGELMPDGTFLAWDCACYAGEDIRLRDTVTRLWAMNELCRAWGIERVLQSYDGGELLKTVLAGGGEGIVRKLPDSNYFAPMLACKRLQQWRCLVTAIGPGQSVSIADEVTRESRGRVALRGGKCDRVRVGSLLKVEGLELTGAGKIRDARPCADAPDSWLLKF